MSTLAPLILVLEQNIPYDKGLITATDVVMSIDYLNELINDEEEAAL